MLSTGFLAMLVTMAPQSPWVVDAANRPGTHFTDLPPAVAAAATGDTIVVRAGTTYSGFQVTGKALTIRGEGRVDDFTSTWFSGATIEAVPAGSIFTLEGCYTGGLSLRNGSFALASCNMATGVFDRASVAMKHCNCWGGSSALYNPPALTMTNATLVASACSFQGAVGWAYIDIWTCQGNPAGSVAISAANSNLILHDSSVTGGAWSSATWAFPGLFPSGCRVTYYPFSGLALGNSTVRIAGDATTVVAAGASSYSNSGVLAIAADPTSHGTVHGSVTLRSGVSPQIVVGGAPLPRLSMGGSELANREILTSSPVTVTIDGRIPGAPLWMAFTPMPTAPADFGPTVLGEVMLPLSTFHSPGSLDATGRFTITIPGTLVPWLGTPVFGQAVVLDVPAMQFRFSNLDLRLFAP